MHKFLLTLLLFPCFVSGQLLKTYYANILKDHKGVLIPFASVINKTTRQVTITDKNGYFQIAAKAGDIISVAAIGFEGDEIKITSGLLQLHPSPDSMRRPVDPVVSEDYTTLIRGGTSSAIDSFTNSTYSSHATTLKLSKSSFLVDAIQQVSIRNNQLYIYPNTVKRLTFGGSYSTTIEIKSANRLPELQTQYVQGRPQNGALVWQGPETGEPFSFGPPSQLLEFDGTPSAYDANGKLVAVGSGNGKRANVYPNSILHKAFLHTQMLGFHAHLYKGNTYQPALTLNTQFGQTNQTVIVQQNRNLNHYFSTSVGANFRQVSIGITYNYARDRSSNSNRNGFLNRVYQNALLTPVSFDNKQGYALASGQRTYSNTADNPYFLLADPGNAFLRSQHNAGITLEKKGDQFKYKIIQSVEVVQQSANEMYKPGTVYFENGATTQRLQAGVAYALQANGSYQINSDLIRSAASLNYQFNTSRTKISYSTPFTRYHYQRLVHDVAAAWTSNYSSSRFNAGIQLANKFYLSSTTSKDAFFLPSVGAHMQLNRVLEVFSIKLASDWYFFNSELPVNQSLAYTNLLQYAAEQSSQYFPRLEVSRYTGLLPVQHREWSGRIELNYTYRIAFSAETFIRQIARDVFPVYENGKLNLRNIASHQNRGVELQLRVNSNRYRKAITMDHQLSFVSYRSRVTAVEDGYNLLPIAGFSNVHKTLAVGQPLGVITGSTWLRDGSGNVIIGMDGFPLVNAQPQFIGNPVPRFIMKMNNKLYWKNWWLSADWEWKKGGDIWNGTQAVLDYFGRSQNSALLRNTTGHIFTGVMQNGQKNITPVSFLDPAQPVTANRWTRYGYSGVAEAYIQKGDCLRISAVTLSYRQPVKKIVQSLTLTAYVSNLILWSAYKGADPDQLLLDQPNSSGLDFFNLPSLKTFGLNLTAQF